QAVQERDLDGVVSGYVVTVTDISDRKCAEEAIALQLRRQQTLGAITQKVRKFLNIDDILTTVTQQVKVLMQADRVIVFRLFSDGTSRIVEESVSPELPRLRDRHWEDETWSGEILELYWQGQPRIVPDVMADRWTDCLVEYSCEGQIQSKIVAPILKEAFADENSRWIDVAQGNKLWGILVVHACHHKRVWEDSEAQLLQQIANQVAIAIKQAKLFEQIQQELEVRQQTEARLTESNRQLAISNEQLVRVTRLKDEFLANMSHELRTPLNAILGMTEGMQDGVFGTITAQQERALQIVEHSGTHLLELINDILDLAKIESEHVELDCAPTAIAPLCKASLVFVRQQAMKKGLQLNLEVCPDLPQLLIDERRIRQVLINLLNNAVKFTSSGSITLSVTLERSPHPANAPFQVRFSVSDTGIGITPEDIARLFQPFIQVDSALNRQYEGTGLGLALVKRIVELHGGDVSVTSTIGVGSQFMFTLPSPDGELHEAPPPKD
ncbi:MAG TPA: ATP-binding protein, partial [Chroococcidiopsis sp.]